MCDDRAREGTSEGDHVAADTAGDTAGNSAATGGGGGPLLADVRVLDLTDHRGEIGPWLLGWLGADGRSDAVGRLAPRGPVP